MELSLFEAVRQLGLGVVLAISILAMSWFLLKKVFLLIEKLIETHFKSQAEAHKYQKEEHQKIADGMTEVCAKLKAMNGRR